MEAHRKTIIHPKLVGDRTTAMVLARLLEFYDSVYLPFGENTRCDLLVEDGERYIRVQCKTGRLRNGGVTFNACSFTYHHPNNRGQRPYRQHYRGQADLFGVYCPETDGVYLVPVDEVGIRSVCLRIEPPRNAQLRRIRWAADHEISRFIGGGSGCAFGRAAPEAPVPFSRVPSRTW